MAHGIKHDYPSLVNEALPFLARRPLVEVLKKLPAQYYLPWVRAYIHLRSCGIYWRFISVIIVTNGTKLSEISSNKLHEILEFPQVIWAMWYLKFSNGKNWICRLCTPPSMKYPKNAPTVNEATETVKICKNLSNERPSAVVTWFRAFPACGF